MRWPVLVMLGDEAQAQRFVKPLAEREVRATENKQSQLGHLLGNSALPRVVRPAPSLACGPNALRGRRSRSTLVRDRAIPSAMSSLRLPLRVQKVGPVEVPLPAYQSERAAGLDLCAALRESQWLEPGVRLLVPTGLALAIPEGYEGQVRPRSGLALKYGISIVNSPGTIDADYRGMVQVLLINLGQAPFLIEPLSRIAQLVICPVLQAELELVSALDETARGAGGYGSTGV